MVVAFEDVPTRKEAQAVVCLTREGKRWRGSKLKYGSADVRVVAQKPPFARRRDKKLHSARVIPERGSWVELLVSGKGSLQVRIDQQGKFSALTFLRALKPEWGTDDAILRRYRFTNVKRAHDRTMIEKVPSHYACPYCTGAPRPRPALPAASL